ncbi:MAG: insulinase family protein [Bacteroidia bacterium]|nr:insulinase family protein [Bacteroidia bacterium]
MKNLFSLIILLCSSLLFSQQNPPKIVSNQIKNFKETMKFRPPAGMKFIENVPPQSGVIAIPYFKYQLDNGLVVLIHEDHSDPVVYVDVTYHVGSAREQQGRSGFAHFFEHMMFQGSKHVADDQHFKIITEAGGTLNGTTNSDRTNYFEVIPSNQLEKILWLEADRMGFLLDSVTQQKFEIQRATVKNERGQRYDNAPYGLAWEKVGEALFPKGHPYSWQTIGYIEDLNRVDVNDLKRFYMRWYGPNNAVLTIAGDVDIQKTLQWVVKYFGSIPKGKDVQPPTPIPVNLPETRYISYEDNIKFPMLKWVFPAVPFTSDESIALDFLGDILSDGKSSPLYQAFIKTNKANSASAYNYSRELAGQFEFSIRSNIPLSEVNKLLEETLNNWEKNGGASQQDIQKLKNKYISNIYEELYTVQSKGAKLAYYQTFFGTPNYLPKEIEKIKKITPQDVMNVYYKYIKGKNKVVLSVVPKGKPELKAAEDNWKMYNRTIETESDEYKGLTYTEPKDTFDRSKMPSANGEVKIATPAFKKGQTPYMVNYLMLQENEVPKTKILISFQAGHRYEPIEKAGIASVLADMLKESTKKRTAEAMDDKLTFLGSDVSFYATENDFVISVSSLTENLDSTLKLVQEMLYDAKLDTADLNRVIKRKIESLQQRKVTASVIATDVFNKIYYGNANVLSLPVIGTENSLKNITVEDLKTYHKNMLSKKTMNISIISDKNDDKAIIQKLGFLAGLSNASLNYTEPIIPAIQQTQIYFVDKPNAAQSEIIFGTHALPYDATGNFFKSTILNFPFAGAFNSRINYLLREIKGYTYGTRGRFEGDKYSGRYVLNGGFKKDATDSTLQLIMKEFDQLISTGLTNEELQFTKNAMLQSEALKMEAPYQKLFLMKNILDYNLPLNYKEYQKQILTSITTKEINELATKIFNKNKLNIVVVGDKKTVLDKINKLGIPIIELDVNGNMVK